MAHLHSSVSGGSSSNGKVGEDVVMPISSRLEAVWDHPAFVDLLADPFVSRSHRRAQLKPSWQTFLQTTDLIADALQRTAEVRTIRPTSLPSLFKTNRIHGSVP